MTYIGTILCTRVRPYSSTQWRRNRSGFGRYTFQAVNQKVHTLKKFAATLRVVKLLSTLQQHFARHSMASTPQICFLRLWMVQGFVEHFSNYSDFASSQASIQLAFTFLYCGDNLNCIQVVSGCEHNFCMYSCSHLCTRSVEACQIRGHCYCMTFEYHKMV